MAYELTDAQNHQVEIMQNAAYNAVCAVLGKELDWQMEWIGEVADYLSEIICRLFNKTEMEIYPYIQDDPYENTDYFTTPFFWDCNCEKNYIHPKTIKACHVCGAHEPDQPDAMTSEVIRWLATGGE